MTSETIVPGTLYSGVGDILVSMGMTRIDHRELLDDEGEVVGYVDADGMAHEFVFEGGEEDVYPLEAAGDRGKVRTAGERIIVPDGMIGLFD